MHGSQQLRALEGAEIHYDLPFDRYVALGGINFHSLETFRTSPKKAKHQKENPQEPTPAMLEGEFVHAFILEYARTRTEWGVLPGGLDYRTKAGKDVKAEMIAKLGERRVITEDLWNRALGMRMSLVSHPAGKILLDESEKRKTEVTFHWWQHSIAMTRKARLDCLYFEGDREAQPVDIKTVVDASPEAFKRCCLRYGWHRQAAYYMDALHAAGIHASEFRFVLIEKQPPHLIGEYIIGPITLQAAARQNAMLLKDYAHAVRTDTWPDFLGADGYAELIELPDWALGEFEEELYASGE